MGQGLEGAPYVRFVGNMQGGKVMKRGVVRLKRGMGGKQSGSFQTPLFRHIITELFLRAVSSYIVKINKLFFRQEGQKYAVWHDSCNEVYVQ